MNGTLPRFACRLPVCAQPQADHTPGEPILLYQVHRFRMILSRRLPLSSKYLEGQIISGDISSASAMSFSPRGHGRESAFASVEELNPALRDTSASDVPFFLNPAMISAGCQS